MSAWKCSACKGFGYIAYIHEGSQRERRCDSCRGGGEGWAPMVIVGAVLTLLSAAYVWFCNGAPMP